ncbi:hypothetical protein [Pseudomonas sp.]|nr:hypothetical protein [Pseudomonas sp.]
MVELVRAVIFRLVAGLLLLAQAQTGQEAALLLVLSSGMVAIQPMQAAQL